MNDVQGRLVTPDKPAALRARLVAAAAETVASQGLAALKARDLARQAGCALGALYTVFEDMDALILQVNAQTQALLEQTLDGALASADAVTPGARLQALASAYLAFATEHRARWDALFAHRMSGGRAMPEGFAAQQAGLFARIEAPLASLCPTMPASELSLLARSVFSAVHGVVALGLDQRVAAMDAGVLRGQVQLIVAALVAGLGAPPTA